MHMFACRRSIVIAALLTLMVGCGNLGPRPEIRAINPRIAGVNLKGVDLEFDVDVSNPYPVPLRTPRFRYGLDVEEQPFLSSESEVDVDLPAAGVGTATLPVRVGYGALWQTLKGVADAKEINYRLHGAFLVSALGRTFELPLSHEDTLPVVRAPKLRVKDVDYSDISLAGARVTLDAEIENPNVFEIDVSSLGYRLQLGQIGVGGLTAASDDRIPAGKSGVLKLAGEITGRAALAQLLRGDELGRPQLDPTGALRTPFGVIDLAP